MSAAPQTNEPAVPEDLSAAGGDSAGFGDLFPEPPARSRTRDASRPRHPQPVESPGTGEEAGSTAMAENHVDVDSQQLEARVVKRLVRHISPWSVLKVSTLLYLSMYVVFLLAGIGLWTIAANQGVIGSFESFMDELLAEENFAVNGAQVLRLSATVGIIGVVVASALTVLFAIIFNLISDVTGGIRLSVVELETARRVRRRSSRRDRE